MRLTNNIYIEFYNPNQFFCLGIYQEKTFTAWIPEEDEPTEDDFVEMNRLVIGFLIGGITILY